MWGHWIVRHHDIDSLYCSAQLRRPGNCPEGVYLSPTDGLDRLEGVIFVRGGYYQGGVYRFTITFPPAFPVRAPIVIFAKGCLIHPLVDVSSGS